MKEQELKDLEAKLKEKEASLQVREAELVEKRKEFDEYITTQKDAFEAHIKKTSERLEEKFMQGASNPTITQHKSKFNAYSKKK